MKKFMKVLLVLCVAAVLAINSGLIINAVFSVSRTVPSKGSLTAINVGVFSDEACTVNATQVDWGIMNPDSTVNRTVYIKNAGNTAEVLSLVTKDWVPTTTSNYVSVTWNLEGFLLKPGNSATANLALIVSPNIVDITDFTANLIISGTT